jgi:hypothetical protein
MSPKGARSPRQRSRIRYASAASDALRGNRACRRRGPGAGDLAFPLDHLLGQGVEQDPAQVTAEHPRRPAGAVVGLLQQHRAVLVEHARGLGALVDDRAELAGEAGRFERELPVVLVDVELAALRSGLGAAFQSCQDGAHGGQDAAGRCCRSSRASARSCRRSESPSERSSTARPPRRHQNRPVDSQIQRRSPQAGADLHGAGHDQTPIQAQIAGQVPISERSPGPAIHRDRQIWVVVISRLVRELRRKSVHVHLVVLVVRP